MLCGNCGAKLDDDSLFCDMCGAPVEKNDMDNQSITVKVPDNGEITYPDFIISNESFEIRPVALSVIANMLNALKNAQCEFVIATPDNEIQGSRFIQACGDDNGQLHLEVCMAGEAESFSIYYKNGILVGDAIGIITLYVVHHLIPDLNDGWMIL